MMKLKRMMLAAVFVSASVVPVMAQTVPCEDLIKQLDDAMKTAKVSDADKAKAMDLRKSGVEKCRLEKDAAADQDLKAALKLAGK